MANPLPNPPTAWIDVKTGQPTQAFYQFIFNLSQQLGGSGGGGGLGVATTGDAKITFKTVADAGWILVNDGSIGDASSNATTRANADTQSLFVLLYNNITSLVLQDSTGATVARGASAAADYAAHRRLLVPTMLGRSLAVAGAGVGLTSRPLGTTAGAETETPTIAKTASHNHIYHDVFSAGSQVASGSPAVGGDFNTSLTGGGTALNILDPSTYVNFMIKL